MSGWPLPRSWWLRADHAAAVVVGQIAAKIRGAPNSPTLPVEAIREHIHRLHPEADEQDILPAPVNDRMGVELMERHVITTIERLNVRSASGATGWTDQCIRTLMLLHPTSVLTTSGGRP
jgi:hypothetical protein